MASCCEYTGAAVVGDTAAVITIESGSPDPVSGLTIYAQGCDSPNSNCGYEEAYNDQYCDITEGGAYPNARITDFSFTINGLPPNSILIIDAAEHTVSLTDNTGNVHESQLDVIDWNGLWEWIEAARNGCQQICIDTSGADLNGDTTFSISTYDREL